ncbi:zinc-binding alcohol dehydrogenase family protein [Nocardiopsis valliformis]|uniref:zinc-binding alcohol dehydrogenase family protein n=1 Tax=Nocardiopsis valliformis TaxID=239974 RepID=UPI000345BD5C
MSTTTGFATAEFVTGTMAAWEVAEPGPIESEPLRPVRRPVPEPGPDELLIRVLACGVCRTDLHVSEGDLPVRRPRVVPGHEVVGEVVGTGSDAQGAPVGSLVGVAWLRHTCGRCRFCLRGDENLCPRSRYTGWDADGGYAEYTTAPAAYTYRLPAGAEPRRTAPLLCAGIIGYRALERACLPEGGRLGVYGFGGSAHLAAQIALARGARLHVLTRDEAARRLALELGASSARGAYDQPPEKLDSAVLFAPVGDLVPVALSALDRGGVLSVAGIHLSDVPPLNYQEHLFQERELRSVTSNTRADGRAFLEEADRAGVSVTVTTYPLGQAQQALKDLKAGRFAGAAVLVPDTG